MFKKISGISLLILHILLLGFDCVVELMDIVHDLFLLGLKLISIIIVNLLDKGNRSNFMLLFA